MSKKRLYFLIFTAVITSMIIAFAIVKPEKDKNMKFEKVQTDLMCGAILTPYGIKSMDKQSGGKDWFYATSGLKVDDFWMLEKKDIKQAEQLVLSSLVERIKDPDNAQLHPDRKSGNEFTDEGIREILENYLSYYRQYVGLIIDGERFIYFNSFPQEDIEQDSSEEEWGGGIIVEDGGSSYWRILVGTDRNKCVCLSMNGEA